MKVKTLISFKDLEKDTIREIDEVFEVTKKRATELSTEKEFENNDIENAKKILSDLIQDTKDSIED